MIFQPEFAPLAGVLACLAVPILAGFLLLRVVNVPRRLAAWFAFPAGAAAIYLAMQTSLLFLTADLAAWSSLGLLTGVSVILVLRRPAADSTRQGDSVPYRPPDKAAAAILAGFLALVAVDAFLKGRVPDTSTRLMKTRHLEGLSLTTEFFRRGYGEPAEPIGAEVLSVYLNECFGGFNSSLPRLLPIAFLLAALLLLVDLFPSIGVDRLPGIAVLFLLTASPSIMKAAVSFRPDLPIACLLASSAVCLYRMRESGPDALPAGIAAGMLPTLASDGWRYLAVLATVAILASLACPVGRGKRLAGFFAPAVALSLAYPAVLRSLGQQLTNPSLLAGSLRLDRLPVAMARVLRLLLGNLAAKPSVTDGFLLLFPATALIFILYPSRLKRARFFLLLLAAIVLSDMIALPLARQPFDELLARRIPALAIHLAPLLAVIAAVGLSAILRESGICRELTRPGTTLTEKQDA